MTISHVRVDHYTMVEDLVGYWTDEMIEGLVEEECPQDFIEKYCISCGTQRCDRTKEYLNGCPYYNAYMCIKQNNDMEEEMSLDKAGQITDFEYEGLEYTLPEGYIFKDENGNVINATKIVLEKKKKEYPKTYKECCKVLGYDDRETYCVCHTYANERLFESLYRLKVCRDAYWKIAGDEMGLDKPWEPDWKKQDKKYIISVFNDTVIYFENETYDSNTLLAFPTEEMRDAFKENFDPDIEICKEWL